MKIDGGTLQATNLGALKIGSFAEVLDKIAAAQSLGDVRALYEQAKPLATGAPFRIHLVNVAFDAVVRLEGRGNALRDFGKQLREATLNANAAVVRPKIDTQLAFAVPAAGERAYDTSRALFSSYMSMLAYEPDASIKSAGAVQGLGNLQIHASRASSARGFTASRADVGVVSLSGTADIRDLIMDARTCLKAHPSVGADGSASGRVHDGFAAQLDSLWPELKKAIVRMRAEDPNRPILFTGHSLGGALAVLAAARAKMEGLFDGSRAVLHTFGQPKVGDAAFARTLDALLRDVPYTREVYRGDPVAQLALDGMGFAHASSALLAVHDGKGATIIGDPAALPPMPQTLDQGLDALRELRRRLGDHDELNYVAAAERNDR